jgi:hypothetical protein
VLLPDKADIYRLLPDPSRAGTEAVLRWRSSVGCLLEPISGHDQTVAYALESTHVVFLPVWIFGLRREDEIRIGGRITSAGTRERQRYIVKGIKRFQGLGLPHQAAYCELRY